MARGTTMSDFTDDDVARLMAALPGDLAEYLGEEEAPYVLDAVAPAIAARALREAADSLLANPEYNGALDDHAIEWLRARAEGEES